MKFLLKIVVMLNEKKIQENSNETKPCYWQTSGSDLTGQLCYNCQYYELMKGVRLGLQ